MRLIDADGLTPCLVKFASDGCIYKIVFASDVEHAHTIDAVPVVRCKDCKNRQDPRECPFCFTEVVDVDGGRLYKFNDLTHDDGFCNRGERRCDNDTP